MKHKRDRAKLRRWRKQFVAERNEVQQVVARLEGRVFQYYVLAPSYTQFAKWCEEKFNEPMTRPPVFVQNSHQLWHVHLNAVVKLIEIDGWQGAATPDLIAEVRRCYARR